MLFVKMLMVQYVKLVFSLGYLLIGLHGLPFTGTDLLLQFVLVAYAVATYCEQLDIPDNECCRSFWNTKSFSLSIVNLNYLLIDNRQAELILRQ